VKGALACAAALTLVCAALLGSSALIGGRFNTTPGPGGVFVTDRLTGDIRFCNVTQCQPVDYYDPWAGEPLGSAAH
jgi:hypothetical protein